MSGAPIFQLQGRRSPSERTLYGIGFHANGTKMLVWGVVYLYQVCGVFLVLLTPPLGYRSVESQTKSPRTVLF